MPRFFSRNGRALAIEILYAFVFANFTTMFAALVWAGSFAPRRATGSYSHPIRFRGGDVAFVPELVGHFIEWGFWAQFALFGLLILLAWFHERTERALRSKQDCSRERLS